MDFGYGAPVAHAYERWLLRRYAHRLLACETRRGRRPPRVAVARWLIEQRALLGLRCAKAPCKLSSVEGGRVERKEWRALTLLYEELETSCDAPAPQASSLELRAAALCDLVRLSPADGAIFGALTRSVLSQPLRDLIQRLEGADGDGGWYEEQLNVGILAAMLGAPQPRVRSGIESGAPLALYGFVSDRSHGEIGLTPLSMTILRESARDGDALRRRLLGRPVASTLNWDDFAHLEGRDIVEALLGAALKERARGVNILLYGAPGTGKTEFSRALAQRLGAQAVFAGETTKGANAEPSRGERIGSVALCGVLAREIRDAFLVVDEADDIFTGVDSGNAGARRGSKAYMNRLVETCEAPTLWITNDPEWLGPAILRRMTYVLRFPAPSRAVRTRIVDEIARRQRVVIDDQHRSALAALDASPAVFAHALRTSRLAGRGGSAALDCARATLRVLGDAAPPQAPQPIAFDAALLRADADLIALRDRIARCGTLNLSFCFHGLPGTGKSAYARHLAQRLGLDVVERRASDLLSKWLGETEQAIRDSFEEAADRRAFLIFDEADSLLASREGAQRSWEVSQVNEMLVSMERHPYPFACTTNAVHALDAASLRRFLFKVRFLPMERAQIAAAFTAAFACEAPREVLDLGNLTPGDFAVVARKARVLGETAHDALAGWLIEEAAAKPGARLARIGF